MTRLHVAAPLVLAGLFATTAAQAEYVRATYSGSVSQVATPGQDGLNVGTAIDFSVVYDPSKAVDYSANFTGTGLGSSVPGGPESVQAISLADDPNASLSITVGGVSFTKFDGLQYGTPFGDCDLADCGPGGLGAGNLPAVLVIGGKFAGVGNILINGLGISIDADPIADYFAGGFGLDGPGADSFDFYIGQGDLDDPFSAGLAVGNIDLSTLQVTAVPEPASWALCLAGVALMGGIARARRKATAAVAPALG